MDPVFDGKQLIRADLEAGDQFRSDPESGGAVASAKLHGMGSCVRDREREVKFEREKNQRKREREREEVRG